MKFLQTEAFNESICWEPNGEENNVLEWTWKNYQMQNCYLGCVTNECCVGCSGVEIYTQSTAVRLDIVKLFQINYIWRNEKKCNSLCLIILYSLFRLIALLWREVDVFGRKSFWRRFNEWKPLRVSHFLSKRSSIEKRRPNMIYTNDDNAKMITQWNLIYTMSSVPKRYVSSHKTNSFIKGTKTKDAISWPSSPSTSHHHH